jgi:hypothetical protein
VVTPLILATQETETGRIAAAQGQSWTKFARPYLENIQHKKGLVEGLKVKALSSSPSTTKTKNKQKKPLQLPTCPGMDSSMWDTKNLEI